EAPLPCLEETYSYCQELLLRHAVHCPPASVAVFGPGQVDRVAAYVLHTLLRHAKLYAYALTAQLCLDVTFVYVGGPEPSLEGEVLPSMTPEEGGETPGQGSTGSPLREVAVAELAQV
ncbi:Coiled-coil domain-containing protein C16orf93, partial [Tinamus guttatus]